MLDQRTENVLNYLEKHEAELFLLLEKLVNTDSYSWEKSGNDVAGEIILEYLGKSDIPTKAYHQEKFGNQLLASINEQTDRRPIVLMGHRDTVFPSGTVLKRPFTRDESTDRCYGPGVADMKGGIALMVFVLKALTHCGITDIPVQALFTSDEEIGSPTSKAIIKDIVQHAEAVFNLEAGRADGSVVTERKGAGHLHLVIDGKSAHAGLAFEKGISANVELAHKILSLQELVDIQAGNTVNVGLIKGGDNGNVVSEHAEARIQFSFADLESADTLMAGFNKTTETSFVSGTSATLSGGVSFLPMNESPGNKKLFETVKNCGALLNIPVVGTATRGAADSGLPSSMGIPTICGMGPVGGNYHTPEEYIETHTLLERAKLLAASIIAVADSAE
ncbi:M20 family metallopeptidase [Halodesulfovibrio sp.]|uniref:M20 family metallopeptidase n=1 Tax=Halodesulfovibrio sp. TaxID=1912772 RepID=UPI0025B8E885|nr:M20 family metallopeptidase [Halodesulfovibrio sp.]